MTKAVVVLAIGIAVIVYGRFVWVNKFGISDAMQNWNASFPGSRSYYGEMNETTFRRMMGTVAMLFGSLLAGVAVALMIRAI